MGLEYKLFKRNIARNLKVSNLNAKLAIAPAIPTLANTLYRGDVD